MRLPCIVRIRWNLKEKRAIPAVVYVTLSAKPRTRLEDLVRRKPRCSTFYFRTGVINGANGNAENSFKKPFQRPVTSAADILR